MIHRCGFTSVSYIGSHLIVVIDGFAGLATVQLILFTVICAQNHMFSIHMSTQASNERFLVC